MKIGILSLQGDFKAHAWMLRRLGVDPVEVRQAKQLSSVAGLILPGGESTTMLNLIERENLHGPLIEFSTRFPVLGTCAGAILMAVEVRSPAQRSLRLIDMTIERNAYGRQIESSIRRVEPEDNFIQRTVAGPIEAAFIRAPKIRRIGEKVTVLAAYDDAPILVEQGHLMAATFHPELSNEQRIHTLFLNKIQQEP